MDFLLDFFLSAGFLHVVFCSMTIDSVKNITATVGEICTLPCFDSATTEIRAFSWSNVDKKTRVLAYMRGRVLPQHQGSQYADRAELAEPQIRGGDLSVVLKHVTLNDSAIYQCQIAYRNKWDRVITHLVRLSVREREPGAGLNVARSTAVENVEAEEGDDDECSTAPCFESTTARYVFSGTTGHGPNVRRGEPGAPRNGTSTDLENVSVTEGENCTPTCSVSATVEDEAFSRTTEPGLTGTNGAFTPTQVKGFRIGVITAVCLCITLSVFALYCVINRYTRSGEAVTLSDTLRERV